MKRLLALLLTLTLGISGLIGYDHYATRSGAVEKLIHSVVIVNTATGIVVHSDEKRALVLTAYHVVDDDVEEAMCSNCYYDTKIAIKVGDEKKYYTPLHITHSEAHDLAIVEIEVDRKIPYVRIHDGEVKLGDEIYIAANPERMYRSLKKGIISSLSRSIGGVPITEIGGGVIFGSSGGGVFSLDGELIGVIMAVRMWNSGHCYFHPARGPTCIATPIPYLGFSVPHKVVKPFMLNGPFGDKFNYLR